MRSVSSAPQRHANVRATPRTPAHTTHTAPPHTCSGAKFAKLRRRYDAENSLEKYEPFITQSANFP